MGEGGGVTPSSETQTNCQALSASLCSATDILKIKTDRMTVPRFSKMGLRLFDRN